MTWGSLYVFCVIFLPSLYELTLADTATLSRVRRGATDFYNVIQCYQPDALVLKVYGDYGCYCGIGGRGNYLDATDKCCHIHDKCYAAAEKNSTYYNWKSVLIGPLAVSYEYECSNGKIRCAQEKNPDLAQGLCECDKSASKCFAEGRSTYDERLMNINPDKWCVTSSNVSKLLSELPPHSTTDSATSRNATDFMRTTGTSIEATTGSSTDNGTAWDGNKKIYTSTQPNNTNRTNLEPRNMPAGTDQNLVQSTTGNRSMRSRANVFAASFVLIIMFLYHNQYT